MLSLLFCLFFLNGVICPSLFVDQNISNEVETYFKLEKIDSATSNEKKLARRLIIKLGEERQRHQDAIRDERKRNQDAIHDERKRNQDAINDERKRNQDAIHEERKRGDDLATKIISLEKHIVSKEKDKATCDRLLKEVTCGRQFRYFMEMFGIDQGVKKGNDVPFSQAMKAAMKTINSNLRDRRAQISHHVYNLEILYGELSSYSGTFFNSDELTPWKNKVKQEFTSMRNFHINRRSSVEWNPYATTRNLSDLVIDFNSAANDSDAVDVFRKQCDHCFWSKENIIQDEATEINKLAIQWSNEQKKDLIPEVGKKNGFTPNEHRFLRGMLNIGRYFIFHNKNYQHCTEVFYFGDGANVKILTVTIESKWGKKNFEVLVDHFCFAFSALYDAVSVTNIHAPAPVPDECKPNETDYQQFINNIASNPAIKEDYLVIATTLGLISSSPNE